jgi:nucleoid-associated protein YgaU
VTANESETSAIQSPASDGAEEELWLTYLNYDQRIQQAVRRLGALSAENVDVFRSQLLKSRDRSKVKDYEAESIRRLQGEAFVGDEELQRTLIVLTAEDPRFGEELKRLVGATGKPEQLDQAVAAIRSGKAAGKQAPAAVKDQVKDTVKERAQERAQERTDEPAKELVKEPAKEPATEAVEAVIVPLRKERAAPAPRPVLREEPQDAKSSGGMKRLVVAGAIVLIGVAGLAIFLPGLVGGSKPSGNQVAATSPIAKPQAEASVPAPQPAAPQPPAPAVDIAMPGQADKSAAPSPPLRPASAQPDAPTSDAAPVQPDVRPAPVAGSSYKVVRGDMLSDIALKVYHDASKFRLIQSANPGIRNSPDRILVDQVIFIPPDSASVSR